MDDTDLSPSRLARARYEIFDLLEANADQQNALIVFAEEPFVAVPLTEDIQVIEEMVPLLSTDLMPGTGSRPGRAIREAMDLLQRTESGSGQIILLSDRPDALSADTRAARAARAAGFRVSAIGFGKDETGLREIVAAGGGQFAQTRADGLDIETVLADPLTYGFGEQDSQLSLEVWKDAGIWLVLIPLLLAPLAFRRGWLLMFFVALVLGTPATSNASFWDDLWASRDERGAIAFEENRKSEAAELFDSPDWRAASLYGAGDFAAAAESYGELPGSENLYNQANALARQGDLQTALSTYEEVLAAQPDHEDATFNRDLIKNLLEQQQEQEQEQQQDSQEQQDGEQGENSENSDGQPSDQNGDPQSGENSDQESADNASERPDDGEPGDPEQADAPGEEEQSAREEQDLEEQVDKALAEAEEEAEPQGTTREQKMARMNEEITEEAQAREQKLRQIPQDPAGLLRAKIRQRYAERRYAPQEY
jgi:Ca-activated chloride channel family protein